MMRYCIKKFINDSLKWRSAFDPFVALPKFRSEHLEDFEVGVETDLPYFACAEVAMKKIMRKHVMVNFQPKDVIG